MKWDIDRTSASGSIQRAAAHADDYGSIGEGFTAVYTRAATGLAKSGSVAEAFGEFYKEVVTPDFTAVTNRTSTAVKQTTEALGHYADGDTELAANAQDGIRSADAAKGKAPGGGS